VPIGRLTEECYVITLRKIFAPSGCVDNDCCFLPKVAAPPMEPSA
jgi:hypothetical protein